jgi:hypothetical protein
MRDSGITEEAESKTKKKSTADVELSRLVKNVKRKAEENQQRLVKSRKLSKIK